MTHINQRRDLASTWASINPVLQLGEVGWERDTRKNKVGDGVTAWNDLDYSHPVTKADIGLGLVDNTSDITKPVSSPQAAALALKADLASPSFTGNPTAPTPAPGDDDTSIATTAFVTDAVATATAGAVPSGTVFPYAGASVPVGGYLLCDGAAVSRGTYAALFTVIGETYGPGDGSTTFNVPNMGGRVPVGVGTATGAAGATAHTLAEADGEETHTLTAFEMPTHTHIQNSHLHAQNVTGASGGTALRKDVVDDAGGYVSVPQGANTGSTTATNQTTGGSGAHNNMQPFLGLNFIIKT